MKNLGKILLFLSLFHASLFALEVKISPTIVHEGDQVTLSVSAQGDEITFPKLETIAGYNVESQAISRNITNINGVVSKTLSKAYIFTPSKDFTVEAIEVEIDGKKELTAPLKVSVKKEQIGKGAPFEFLLQADKKEAYIGEGINVTFVFKKHLNVELAEANFNSPSFHDFWAKPLEKLTPEIEGEYLVYRIKYLLFAQKSGDIQIDPARMDAGMRQNATREMFNFERVQWKSVFSNDLTVKVNPLPQGVDVYGNFTFSATVDKQQTKANEPINLTLTIKGIGNIDDIDAFKLDIKDAIVYADKPQRKILTNNKEELGEFTQKFAIVSDRDFTIEPLEFIFFHSGEKAVKKLQSEKLHIKVEGGKKEAPIPQLEKKAETITKEQALTPVTVYDKASQTQLVLFGIGGFLLVILSALLFMMRPWEKKTEQNRAESPLAIRIKKSKNDKELLSLLLPFTQKSTHMREIVHALEENVYEGKSALIDKKALLKHLEAFMQKEKEIEDILK